MQYITFYNGKFTIPQNIPVTDREKFEEHIRKAYKVNRKFWKMNVLIKVKLIYSRADFNRDWGGTTRKWNCAFTSDQKVIVIFAPSVFGRLTDHKPSEYSQILTHEMAHIFYMNFVSTYTPVWLGEGLAMYVAGQGKRYRGKISGKYLRYSFTKKDLGESDKDARQFYRNSYLSVYLLIKKRGVRAIMNFLKSYRKHRTEEAYITLYKKFR